MATPKVLSRTSSKADLDSDYKYGFVTDIESDIAPKGLNEDVVRMISAKKKEPEFLLEWRLKAFRHWIKQDNKEPGWAKVSFPQIDYQDIHYYAAPVTKKDAPSSLDEVDPELVEAFNKLGIPIEEQKRMTGVAVDAIFDSVSVATTYQKTLEEAGVIFCSVSEAIERHPDIVEKIPGFCSAVQRQFLRNSKLSRFQRRILRVHTQRRSLSNGTDDIFPHQLREHRSVRTNSHHRRRRLICKLFGGMHRTDEKISPIACRSRGTNRIG